MLKKKNFDFQFQMVFLITFSEGNIVLILKRTIPLVLLFVMMMLTKLFCVIAVPFSVRGGSYWETDFRDKAKDKNLISKKCGKTQDKLTGFWKIATIIFYVKIQVFEKSKIWARKAHPWINIGIPKHPQYRILNIIWVNGSLLLNDFCPPPPQWAST